jgi:hypothetical protein
LLLHVLALLLPVAAIALFASMVDRDFAHVVRQAALFGGAGALSAQVAALLRWRALERRARAGHGGWITGLGMAAITHGLFGVLIVIGLAVAAGDWHDIAGTVRVSDLFVQALFFIAVSVLPVGMLTFPLTAAIAEFVARVRQRELPNVAA